MNKEQVPRIATIFNMSKASTRFGQYWPSSEGNQHFKEITSKYDIQGLGKIMETLKMLYAFL
jgi:hypothetical protein